MKICEFLNYSAGEPMVVLRKRYNQGENLYKAVPAAISRSEALEDIQYLRYVMERAYSGYGFYEKACFDGAFAAMAQQVNAGPETLSVNGFIDLIAGQMSFISDGHLSLTTQDYGKGFYRMQQTYVADLLVFEKNGRYVDSASGEAVALGEGVRLFPTISAGEWPAFLVGTRSKAAVGAIHLKIGDEVKAFPVHKIRSRKTDAERLIAEEYCGNTAYIACSTFVGDDEADLKRFFDIGRKCRAYAHVVLDLSNNLGGNSEFPKQFLTGLNGVCVDTSKILELRSTLVHAKECGRIEEIPYHFEDMSCAQAGGSGSFEGTLHVIINDRVASSAESAIIMARSLKNVVFYGCNSMGIGRFGDLCIYYFPHSKITFWCPQKRFENSIPETVGFEPDIWLDGEDTASMLMEQIQKRA